MPTPQDIHILAWLMIPFVTASEVITVRQLIKTVTLARALMVASCFFVLVAEVALILIFGGYTGIKVSTWIFLGGTSMHLARWITRIYVCLRMIKLSPSPAMGTAFNNLIFVSIGFLIMVLSNFIFYTWEWYETHSTDAPVLKKNPMAIVGIVLSSTLFDITSVYLHIKSLMKFGATGATGLKLYVLSISTLGSVVFALGHTYGQITHDSKLELLFVGIELAMLPSSIVLGELIAIAIGTHLGKKFSSISSKSRKSESRKSESDIKRTIAKTSSMADADQKILGLPKNSAATLPRPGTPSSPDNAV